MGQLAGAGEAEKTPPKRGVVKWLASSGCCEASELR